MLDQHRAALEQLLTSRLGDSNLAAERGEPLELGAGLGVRGEPHLGVARVALLHAELVLDRLLGGLELPASVLE